MNDGKIYNFKIRKKIHFLKNKIICFVNVEIDPNFTHPKFDTITSSFYLFIYRFI